MGTATSTSGASLLDSDMNALFNGLVTVGWCAAVLTIHAVPPPTLSLALVPLSGFGVLPFQHHFWIPKWMFIQVVMPLWVAVVCLDLHVYTTLLS